MTTPRPSYRVREVLVEETPPDGDGNIYEYHVLGKHGGIVAVCQEQSDAALIVAARNIYDKAKVALEGLLIHGKGEGKLVALYVPQDMLDQARAVLATMNGGAK